MEVLATFLLITASLTRQATIFWRGVIAFPFSCLCSRHTWEPGAPAAPVSMCRTCQREKPCLTYMIWSSELSLIAYLSLNISYHSSCSGNKIQTQTKVKPEIAYNLVANITYCTLYWWRDESPSPFEHLGQIQEMHHVISKSKVAKQRP